MTPKKPSKKKVAAKKKVALKKSVKKTPPRKKASKKPSKKENAVSQGFTELVGRALTDKEFREKLFDDRPSVIRDFRLTPDDIETLDRLSKRQLEEQAKKLGGRAAITIKVVISKSF